MKINQNREQTAMEIANIINNCSLLLKLDIETKGSGVFLTILTDSVAIEYRESSRSKMNLLLMGLIDKVDNCEDIKNLIEELHDAEHDLVI